MVQRMDSSLSRTVGLAAITAVITVFVARADGGATTGQAGGTLAADSAAVRADSAPVAPKWIHDDNVLAAVAAMNGRQIAAANTELSSWHSDTVRAIAAGLAHQHAELQRSADSLAAALRMTPVPSALTDEIAAAFQAQVDSLAGNRGGALDRAFVAEQVASHRLMASYLDQLAGLAEAPALQAWLSTASATVSSQIDRLAALQGAFAAADSAAADSLARRGARRQPRTTNR